MKSKEAGFEPSSEDVEFQKKKTAYFSAFALRHLKEMRVLKKGGILGKENADWRNVSEHCLVEAVGADILAEALRADRDVVVQSALLHDWYKRREVEAMKELGGGGGYRGTVDKDEEALREYGVDPLVIEIAHANIPKNADPQYLSRRSIEEKIMHYMDTVTSGSEWVDFRERFALLEQKPRNVEFSESFKDQYDGKPLYEVQLELAQSEENDFREKMGLTPEEDVIGYLKKKLEERIKTAIL